MKRGIRKASGVIAYHQTPTRDGRQIDYNDIDWLLPIPICRVDADGFPEAIGFIERTELVNGNLIIGHGWVGGCRRWQRLRVALSLRIGEPSTAREVRVLTILEQSAWADGTGLRVFGRER